LQKDLYDLSARSPFVNVRTKDLWFYEEQSEQLAIARKLHKKAQFFKKEYALDTALNVKVYLKWTFSNLSENEQNRYFVSPLLFRPCDIIRSRKIDTTFRIENKQEFLSVNPILRHFFSRKFDINLVEEVENMEDFLADFSDQLSEGANRIQPVYEFDDTEEWQFIILPSCGIFNYKKSLLGADYELIATDPSEGVKAILGETSEEKTESGKLIQTNPLDRTQREVIARCLSENYVVQGPPGTGKSHTIVSLISNYLAEGKKVLFVSEKRSALDVVFDRLKEAKLHHWAAYFNTEKDEKKSFYAHLKSAWERATGIEAMLEAANEFDFSQFSPSEIFST